MCVYFYCYQNFLFVSKDDNSQLKAIDFGLSDFVKPGLSLHLLCFFLPAFQLLHAYLTFTLLVWNVGLNIILSVCCLLLPLNFFDQFLKCYADERLNDIVGSAYYVAPEVLHRSYSTEADVWSIGVIAYILLCGSRPFWDRTESGIFRAVLKANPSFSELPWPTLSPEAKDFVRRLLSKDPRRRMSAAQALSECSYIYLISHMLVLLVVELTCCLRLQVIPGLEVMVILKCPWIF